MGASFAVALALVIFAGAELFTGNTMVLTLGVLSGRVRWSSLASVWAWSFFGNLAGSRARCNWPSAAPVKTWQRAYLAVVPGNTKAA